jgi:hypothetical protein
LWQGLNSPFDLLVQAVAEGAAVLIIVAALVGIADSIDILAIVLIGALVLHVGFVAWDNLVAPSPTRHHELAVSAITRGPFARPFWGGAIFVSIVAIVTIVFAVLAGGAPLALTAAAVLTLVGSFAWEYVWVEAGQSVPLS